MSEDEDSLSLFQEPDGYYEPEKPQTFQEHTMKSGRILRLRFVGHNPLWGHLLWQGGRIMSNYLEEHIDELIRGRTVLELGAGGGLPSLVCAIHGAKQVFVTDYPDADLVANLSYNIHHSTDLELCNIAAGAYLWGAALPPYPLPDGLAHLSRHSFEIILLADLLFNHHCHEDLLKSVSDNLALTQTAKALVFFTPYRPWLLDKDLAFFDLVRADQTGLEVVDLGRWEMERLMFDEDPGDEALRKAVFGFEIHWKSDHIQAKGSASFGH